MWNPQAATNESKIARRRKRKRQAKRSPKKVVPHWRKERRRKSFSDPRSWLARIQNTLVCSIQGRRDLETETKGTYIAYVCVRSGQYSPTGPLTEKGGRTSRSWRDWEEMTRVPGRHERRHIPFSLASAVSKVGEATEMRGGESAEGPNRMGETWAYKNMEGLDQFYMTATARL